MAGVVLVCVLCKVQRLEDPERVRNTDCQSCGEPCTMVPLNLNADGQRWMWDQAGTVADRYVERMRRRHDRVLAAVLGPLMMIGLITAVVVAVVEEQWWFAVFAGMAALVSGTLFYGIYTGWDGRHGDDR